MAQGDEDRKEHTQRRPFQSPGRDRKVVEEEQHFILEAPKWLRVPHRVLA